MGKESIPPPQSLDKISFHLRIKDLSTINKICCEDCLPKTIFFFLIIFKDIVVFTFYVNKSVTCISICMCIVKISSAHGSRKASDPLELGLQL